MINRSESQLIAREQHNQVLKTAKAVVVRKPARGVMPKRKTSRS